MKAIVVIIFSSFAFAASGQNAFNPTPIEQNSLLKDFGKSGSVFKGYLEKIVQQVKDLLGQPKREFEVILLNNGNNAYAFQNNGVDVVAFDTSYLRLILENTDSYWAVVGVVAHEIGHHYYNHPIHPIGSHLQEQGADFISGLVLGRLGAPLSAGERLLQFIVAKHSTPTHPNLLCRRKAFQTGWRIGMRKYLSPTG